MTATRGIVSYSEIAKFQQCPLAWHLSYVDGLTEPPDRRRPGLSLGTGWHTMLQARYESFREYDNAGEPRDLDVALVEAWRSLNRLIESGRENITDDQREQLVWMWTGYNQRYGTDDDWEILDTESTDLLPLTDEISLKTKIDLTVLERSKGRVWLVDHKSMKGKDASGAAWARDRDLDLQFTLYQALKVRQGLDVVGAIYAAARTDQLKRKMTLEERFGRHLIVRSKPALDRALEQTIAVVEAMRRFETGEQAIYASPVADRCGWSCSFREVHLHADATGRDYAEVAQDWGFVPYRSVVEGHKGD